MERKRAVARFSTRVSTKDEGGIRFESGVESFDVSAGVKMFLHNTQMRLDFMNGTNGLDLKAFSSNVNYDYLNRCRKSSKTQIRKTINSSNDYLNRRKKRLPKTFLKPLLRPSETDAKQRIETSTTKFPNQAKN